ncbi:unnamed protein product, partial [Musa textilis]
SVAAAPAAFSRVAVIGAGAAGLVAARELRREGLRVVVFERDAAIGGTWVYTPATESDPLGLDPGRGIVQTSLYESLRTNLPRECMGFLDYPFSSRRAPDGGDTRRFPGHREVLRYLQDFARDFDLYGLIRFHREVETVERDRDGRWQVIRGALTKRVAMGATKVRPLMAWLFAMVTSPSRVSRRFPASMCGLGSNCTATIIVSLSHLLIKWC